MSRSAAPARPLEATESSTPTITRAVAAALGGGYHRPYEFAAWQRAALDLLGRLPQAAARFAIARFETFAGFPAAALADLTSATLADARLRDYADLPGRFPAVTLGAGLGGAAASIALAVGGPFLPQAFVVILRGGAYDGDPETYRRLGQPLALRLAARNPDLLTIQHYDPVHDEWMTRYANHLRFKLLDLPAAYRDFLRARLEPGGAVVYLDSGASWLRYRLGARSFFQVGGWGDISAQEFIASSPRLRAYAQRVGLTRHAWGLRDYPLETGPESEWGTEPGLGAALERFCAAEGYRFVPIHLPEPHDFSRLAFTAAAARLAAAGRPPAGVLIEMFTQFDPYAALQADLLPLWLIFNTHDSLEFLQSMRPSFPPAAPVFFSPLATFTPTPDLTPFAAWEAALAGTDWRSIGARPSHYPADAAALSHWQEPLRAWAAAHAQPPTAPLAAETLAALAAALPPAGAA